MKAIHKYLNKARAGNSEAQRRIAQSRGYRTTIHDMPHMISLMARAGIVLPGYQVGETFADTTFTQTNSVAASLDNPHTVEVDTIQL